MKAGNGAEAYKIIVSNTADLFRMPGVWRNYSSRYKTPKERADERTREETLGRNEPALSEVGD